jgi:hypothetical protein
MAVPESLSSRSARPIQILKEVGVYYIFTKNILRHDSVRVTLID